MVFFAVANNEAGLSNPLANLDLIDYACQDLMVSFAVANNEAGLSTFSSTTNVHVTVNIRGT